jgi:C4-dicarboxylate transporter/malic acid transport protein
MATLTATRTATGACSTRAGAGFLAELEGASPVGLVGPNWFASVMGTGIVAVALVSLPFAVPGARVVALGFWLLATALLVAVTAATVAHHVRHPEVARRHLGNPVMAHFYGAPAMALMTVGAGAVLVGSDLVGTDLALGLDVVLWTTGTLLGLATAVVVPYLAITRHEVQDDSAFGGWLMPVVPAMVSAATGALLVPHVPAGQGRETLLLTCYALFGVTLLASLFVTAAIWSRLVRHGTGPATAVPTTWIVLGWIGQSVTAAHHLGALAPDVLPAPYGRAFQALGLVYGIPVWGFGMLWLTLAVALTVHAARRHLPFSLTWWSFTFPVGTLVTGTSALAVTTGLVALHVVAGLLMLLLVGAWVLVASRTAHGVYVGRLLRA